MHYSRDDPTTAASVGHLEIISPLPMIVAGEEIIESTQCWLRNVTIRGMYEMSWRHSHKLPEKINIITFRTPFYFIYLASAVTYLTPETDLPFSLSFADKCSSEGSKFFNCLDSEALVLIRGTTPQTVS